MKITAIRIALVLALCVVAALPACVADKVDPLALFGSANATWPAVEQDYELGLEDGLADGAITLEMTTKWRAFGDDMEAALAERDRTALLSVPWDLMEPWAGRGIQSELEKQRIGPTVAESLREQLSNFTKVINRLKGQ